MRTHRTAERRGPDIGQAPHPAQRPAEPDHPMVVEGDVVPGDTVFMLRCMLEDMLGAGIRPDESEVAATTKVRLKPDLRWPLAGQFSHELDRVQEALN